MERLKVGDAFEVVRIIDSEPYGEALRAGKTTIAKKGLRNLYNCLTTSDLDMYKGDGLNWSIEKEQTKLIGRLVITKVK